MKRPFRILILDDDIARDAKAAFESNRRYDWSKKQCHAIELLLAENGPNLNVEVFLAEKAQMVSAWSIPEKSKVTFEHTNDVKRFLCTLDVLILDIGSIGPVRGPQDEEKRNSRFNQAVRANFDMLGRPVPTIHPQSNARHDGIEFFHLHLEDFSKNKNCLIVILTEFDSISDPVIDAYLHPFTYLTTKEVVEGDTTMSVVTDLPNVVKFGKSGNAGLTDAILGHYDFFNSGLSDATNRFQISFAASHDEPVMIVGESGTGKEGIAKFIHKQWARRKKRDNPDLRVNIGRFQVINCGGLSEQLAHAELFGYLRGSFTGAEEHRLGKVFFAAGVEPLGKSPLRGNIGESYQQAEADLKDLRDGFASLEKAPQGEKFRTFVQEVEPHLNGLFRPNGATTPTFMRLISALADAEKKLQTAVSGGSANNDFHDRLLAKSEGLLAKPKAGGQEDNGWDLEYVPQEAIGTLFLDEFADLPLSVQTMLLRFLQDGEVQPLGFAGRILGLKVRIIVATSDSRVAEFAGKSIKGDFRTPAELERPLRIDLLHRVRFQEIRTEPVTCENVHRILTGMIAQKTNPVVGWNEDALSYLVAEIGKLIGSEREPKSSSAEQISRRGSFGHRRELGRVVNLVWEYAKTAGWRGVRDVDLEAKDGTFVAKKGLIQRLWSPAMIVTVFPYVPGPYGPISDSIDDQAVEVLRKRKVFVDGISTLNDPVLLPQSWSWDENVAKNVVLLKQSRDVNNLIKQIGKSLRGKEDVGSRALEGPAFGGEHRDWGTFDKHFTTKRAAELLKKLEVTKKTPPSSI